jgi:ERCC4-type nuclease
MVLDDVTVLTILVDDGERSSGVPSRLRSLGVRVEYRDLRVGDYLVGTSTAVERKSIEDLHRSIANGRLWRQIGAMRSTFDTSYLLVEGDSLYGRRVSQGGVRGALLAVLDGGVRLVWARTRSDSATWLHAIARRASHAASRSRPWAPHAAVRGPAAFLSLVPGVSPSIAADLMSRFGSIGGVALASADDLLAVPGLGPARVATLKRVLA